MRGLPRWVTGQARVVPFNDLAAVQAALEPGDVALVLAEPAMTNAGFLLPEDGFHDGLRRLTREAGTLLAIDEIHSLVCAHGGLSGAWGLEPDFLSVGKSIAAGVPLAAYGMSAEIAALIAPPEESRVVSGVVVGEVSTGGTLFANALSMAAARAALLDVLTEEAFERTAALGERMAAGLRAAIDRAGLAVERRAGRRARLLLLRPRAAAGRRAAPRAADDPDLRALIRVFMANRGVWESGWWLGPTVSVAHTESDVDRYVEVFGEFLAEATEKLMPLVAHGPPRWRGQLGLRRQALVALSAASARSEQGAPVGVLDPRRLGGPQEVREHGGEPLGVLEVREVGGARQGLEAAVGDRVVRRSARARSGSCGRARPRRSASGSRAEQVEAVAGADPLAAGRRSPTRSVCRNALRAPGARSGRSARAIACR